MPIIAAAQRQLPPVSRDVLAVPAFVATENELKLFLCALCDLPVKKDSQGEKQEKKNLTQ